MSEPFLGEIKIISWHFPPVGWAFCDGQIMNISQNMALFALMGTFYGGNGNTTFALPDLRGRVPMHSHNLGVPGGEASHALSTSEMPAHTHLMGACSGAPDQGLPAGNAWAKQANGYSPAANVAMDPSTIADAGATQAHSNMQPYLVLNFVVALNGIFPSRA